LDRYLELAISSSSDAAGSTGQPAGNDRVLRAKYLDWCSARIAERFLELTPEEIYELGQRASRETTTVSRGAPVVSGGSREEDAESFRAMVVRVTEVLAGTVVLPTYREWVKAYEQSPARYDEELLGFWRESL
jgi:hypothetical protein